MAIVSIDEVPERVRFLWRTAESVGFCDSIYMEESGDLMASLPNSTFEDDRVPVSLDMYEIREAFGMKPTIDRNELALIVAQLRWCNYENEAGYLVNNVAFCRLVELAGIEQWQ